ncbi:MAG TPA: tRNA (adenosine(37)-N6)-dimethylallyltransferase MiaA [Caldimonas sp.]|jgi:tRNA dimethylallyltransferase|nr:tRNA (adenosine(37)-N6)-dimethylallyltransferase MiaA [Caldimonas sp.]HEX2541826.1 tRNA (adenosine(37)-N6)-dimethylallyltransferase MiaA [Caldimonas sp.]
MTDSAAGAANARCLCIAGPTASGKSATALAIADALGRDGVPVEIVSVDSALVYRGMDIGTAKPSRAEQALVPHHLIDIVDPDEPYSAARFVADAGERIAAIRARGALPLLVGGTMLYFKALFEGLDALPAADRTLRAAIDARAGREGWPALHAELARLDPATARRLAPHDSQRIQRALEVLQISGRPLSSFHTGAARLADARRDAGAAGPGQPTRPPLLALEPHDRAWLHARIERRFAAMLDAGFVDEVRRLRAHPGLHAELPSMRAVGYRQAWQALESGDLSRLQPAALAATRQLAKRQLTWLRSMPWRTVVAADDADAVEQAVRWARRELAARAAREGPA